MTAKVKKLVHIAVDHVQIEGNIYFGENFEIYITASEFRILHYGWHILFKPKKD